MRRIIAFVVSLTFGTGAVAQPAAPTPPDPATLNMPDMTPTRDSGVIRDGQKYFYFHKAGVSYADAYADFADCYRFVPNPGPAGTFLPVFRPWVEAARPESAPSIPNQYGLVGNIVLGLISGQFERRSAQARLRLCLEPRGYLRYPLREDAWRQLTDNFSQRSIALQALAASGPAPGLEPVAR